MTSFAERIVSQGKLMLTLTFFLVLGGILTFFTIPKEEDPQLKPRFGMITIVYPGASAADITNLIVTPLENEIFEVDGVMQLEVETRPDYTVLSIELNDSLSSISDINNAWRDVQDALDTAAVDFPIGVTDIELNKTLLDQDAVLLSLYHPNHFILREAADHLRDRLLRLPRVSKVNIIADAGEQISIELDEVEFTKRGIGKSALMEQLQGSSQFIPGGSVIRDGKKMTVQSNADFRHLDDIKSFPISLSNGDLIPLSEVAEVSRSIAMPQTQFMRDQRRTTIGIGVVPAKRIDMIRFGADVTEVIDTFNSQFPDIDHRVISFQPDNVRFRLFDLLTSLGIGMLIVAAVLIAAMGVRLGVLTSLLVPIIMLVALNLYGLSGGILHQMSISAFVLALGLLVDNVIVVVESIQRDLDDGQLPKHAAVNSVRQFSLPLLAATITTIAAFIPMLGSSGTTADFTRAIPLVAVLCLSVSFLFAVFVTPIIATSVLQPGGARQWPFLQPVARSVAWVCRRYPGWSLTGCVAILAFFMVQFSSLPQQFFPSADRVQLVVDVILPEGTHVSQTLGVAENVEADLLSVSGVAQVSTFVGRSTPAFFYNLRREPNSPHLAQLIVETTSVDEAKRLRPILQRRLDALEVETPVTLLVRSLDQGPPVRSPIDLRFYSDTHEEAIAAAQYVLDHIKVLPSLYKVRMDSGDVVPELQARFNTSMLADFGLNRAQVARTMLYQSRGIPIGILNENDKNHPIVVKSMQDETSTQADLLAVSIAPARNGSYRVADVIDIETEEAPAIIRRQNGRYYAAILSEVSIGYSVPDAMSAISEHLAENTFDDGVTYAFDGTAAESESANTAIIRVLPIGIMLLLASLLALFRTFKKVVIIQTSIPFTIVGVVIGLNSMGLPFGFMSIVGMLALVGIVVNNAILLLDRIVSAEQDGYALDDAVRLAIHERLRPILLTTITTIAGLVPLAMTTATLWPPFAMTIIGGLLASTVFTVLVVPALYTLLHRRSRWGLLPMLRRGAALILIGLFWPSPVVAMTPNVVDLPMVFERAAANTAVQVEKADEIAQKKRRISLNTSVSRPSLTYNGSYLSRDREILSGTPFGVDIVVNGQREWTNVLSIDQVVLQPVTQWGTIPAHDALLHAQEDQTRWIIRTQQFEAATVFYQWHGLRIDEELLTDRLRLLSMRRSEMRRLFRLKRISESDLTHVQLAINDISNGLVRIREQQDVLEADLKRRLNLRNDQPITLAEATLYLPQKSNNQVRPDVAALSDMITAKEFEQKAVRYQHYPNIIVSGQAIQADVDNLETDNWYAFLIQMQWELYSSGKTEATLEILEAEKKSLRKKQEQLVEAMDIQHREAAATIATLEHDYRLRERAVELAQEAAIAEENRYENGKVSITDLLDAEDVLLERRALWQKWSLEMGLARLLDWYYL